MNKFDTFFFEGEIISDCRLLRPLKINRLCEIWLAYDRNNGTQAVMKLILKGNCETRHFFQIVQAWQSLKTPFLIRFFRQGITPNEFPYVVMEYASGGSLRSRLRKTGKLSLNECSVIFREILEGLSVLHEAGFVHRDIKPDNIWFSSDGHIRLGDSGTLKIPNLSEPPGQVFGTASYLSPEQAKDSTLVNARSDLFSLGSVMYEALTGKRRYSKQSSSEKFFDKAKQISLDCSAPPFEELQEIATAGFAEILCRMMNHRPQMRPKNAKEVLSVFNDLHI